MGLRRVDATWTRWQRWRLLSAYADVFSIRTGKRVGFSPLIHAYTAAERDGLLEFDDGAFKWQWLGDE